MSAIDDLLERTCKNMIQTILFCVDNATKGTIYRIGPMPELRALRVTSGVRLGGSGEIRWGLPSVSDYNPPGKKWEQYRDRPNSVLEAMGWCVEKQRSWTADNPFEDVRSVGKQLRGEIEDYYHMEPVLAPKVDLYGDYIDEADYPRDWQGSPIWQDTKFVTAAVIKIHFLPCTLKRGDRSTKIIRELSRSLGTELLSLHLRESISLAHKELTRQRLHSCEILAHELRNTLIKFGFLFTAVNAQIGILRTEWETLLRETLPELEWKDAVLERLCGLLRRKIPGMNGGGELIDICLTLLAEQEELATLALLPVQAEQWLQNKIRPKWGRLLAESSLWQEEEDEILGLLDRLGRSLWLGTDADLIRRLPTLPEEIAGEWMRLAYVHFAADKLPVLGEILNLLVRPETPIPHKQQIAKVLRSLRVLVELLPEIEERANRIILSLKDGSLSEVEVTRELERIYRDRESCIGAADLGGALLLPDCSG